MAPEKILIAYATSGGSTREIAGSVAEILGSRGLAAQVHPMREVRSLEGYTGVVLGAPLYMFHWHRDVGKFLGRQRKALSAGIPAALFTGGPIGAGDEKEWSTIRSQVDGELAKFPWFHPVSVQLVGGKLDPNRLGFPYSLIPAMRNLPAADLRDWPAIRSWAEDIAGRFSSRLV